MATKQEAAEKEVDRKPRTVKFEGLSIELPQKLPFRALRYMRDDDVVGMFEEVLKPEQMEEVWALDIDVDRGRELMAEVLGHYGITVGEVGASSIS